VRIYIRYIFVFSMLIMFIGVPCRAAVEQQSTDVARKDIFNLMFLPNEIIAHIVGFLSPQFLIQMALMSLRLNQIIKDTLLYKFLQQNDGNLQEALFKVINTKKELAIGYLVQHGAKINAFNKNDKTALMHAACYGHDKAVTELLKNRACVNMFDKNGETALIMATTWQPRNYKKIINQLISARADVNMFTKFGCTALSSVASGQHGEELIALLIEAGADINEAFKKAIDSHDQKGARILWEYGAYISTLTETREERMERWGILQKNDCDVQERMKRDNAQKKNNCHVL